MILVIVFPMCFFMFVCSLVCCGQAVRSIMFAHLTKSALYKWVRKPSAELSVGWIMGGAG